MRTNYPQELGQELICELLPHRYPFLLVDKVLSWEKNQRIIARKQVTANEPFFPGHFPSMPIMPGVLIIEALAQTGGLLALLSGHDDNGTAAAVKFVLAGVDKARFKRMVVPGDELKLEVKVLQVRAMVGRFAGTASVGGELVARAELLLLRRS